MQQPSRSEVAASCQVENLYIVQGKAVRLLLLFPATFPFAHVLNFTSLAVQLLSLPPKTEK